MATTKTGNSELDLREEFEALRTQVSDLLAELQSRSKEKTTRFADRLDSELGDYQDKAREKLQDVYDLGSEGLNEVGERIRRQPVASLLVAFGAGYVLSRLLGSDK